MTDDRRMLHSELTPTQRRLLFHRGIDLFNRGAYYDCHEAFEEIWRSTTPEPRDLFQGLIQVAVGLYHYHRRGRPDVARRVMGKGRRRLQGLGEVCCGIDLQRLLREVDGWREWLPAKDESGHEELPEPPRIVVVEEGAVR